MNGSVDSNCFFFSFALNLRYVFISLHKYGIVGKQAMRAALVNINRTPVHPYKLSIGPISSYPRIEPKPAMPSLIPESVDTARRLFLRSSNFPMSAITIAITIVAPFSNRKKKLIYIVKSAVCVFVYTNTTQSSIVAPIKLDVVCTGDFTTRMSEMVPMIMLPTIPPTALIDMMSPACATVYPKESLRYDGSQ